LTATAIILARAGSKGLPGKNTARVGGRPCIAWTIEAAMDAASVDRVIVSTDDREAAGIAYAMGAEVVERPAELAADQARVDDAARHAFRAVGEPDGPIVVLYANVPVRPRGLIDEGVALMERSGCDSVQSYAAVGKHHPWWTARVDPLSGVVGPWEGDVLNHGVFRRQDLPAAFVPDGGLIVCSPEALMLRLGVEEGPHAFFGRDRRGVVTEEGAVVDIDGRVDLLVADALLGGGATAHPRGVQEQATEGTEVRERGEERRGRIGVGRPEMLASDGAMRELTERVIGCAMRVHSELGPGLLETVYELCLLDELRRSGIVAERQVELPIMYAGRTVPGAFRMDLLVEGAVIVEIKACDGLRPVHEAQLLSYLRLTGRQVGLLLNFHVTRLKDGMRRVVLDRPGSPPASLAASSVSSVRNRTSGHTP
jgi:GxxExxY protein